MSEQTDWAAHIANARAFGVAHTVVTEDGIKPSDLPETTAEYIRGLCVEIQRLKAQLAERDARLTAFIGDLDAAGMTTVALGINDILEGK